jgi:nucleosome binding factor SPN SPT16 subunit
VDRHFSLVSFCTKIYEILLEMQETCLTAMKHGRQLKDVYAAAVDFLKSKAGFESLVQHLPKTLGFGIGLDFREGNMLLSPKSQVTFKKGMVFCLSVGFQNLELTDVDTVNTPGQSPVRFVNPVQVELKHAFRSKSFPSTRFRLLIRLQLPPMWPMF